MNNSYQSDMNDYYIQKKQKVLNNLKISPISYFMKMK